MAVMATTAVLDDTGVIDVASNAAAPTGTPWWAWLMVAASWTAAIVALVVFVPGLLDRNANERDWDQVWAGFGITVDGACAEWRDGVRIYGSSRYEALTMGFAPDPTLGAEWIAYAREHC